MCINLDDTLESSQPFSFDEMTIANLLSVFFVLLLLVIVGISLKNIISGGLILFTKKTDKKNGKVKIYMGMKWLIFALLLWLLVNSINIYFGVNNLGIPCG